MAWTSTLRKEWELGVVVPNCNINWPLRQEDNAFMVILRRLTCAMRRRQRGKGSIRSREKRKIKACTMEYSNLEGITFVLKYLKSSEDHMILLVRLFRFLTAYPTTAFQKAINSTTKQANTTVKQEWELLGTLETRDIQWNWSTEFSIACSRVSSFYISKWFSLWSGRVVLR